VHIYKNKYIIKYLLFIKIKEAYMKVGFVGLGNVGGKLASSLLRNDFDLTVRDLDENLTKNFANLGAKVANSAKELAEQVDLIITCLPSPEICNEVMDGENGIINGLSENKIWLEMSTTDEAEVKRLGKKVLDKKAIPLEGPVSGGCHRAATGNIAIFVGGERKAFEKILPILSVMGKKILHTGKLGSASVLKVITNYLASVHLVALGEAWTIAKKSNLDLAKAYKGIAVSSGNSFVHETESQVILNGSYNINFTMDLVLKDTNLFNTLAKKLNATLEISPKIVEIFKDGQKKYGSRAWSSMIVKRMEDLNKIDFRAEGFPNELTDNEPEEKGYEI
jgi:3-hydroxyisobutyrate dehydrogenase